MYAILLIAAGASSRLGQPKQLLPFRETFLLNFMVNECVESQVGKVYVVLGAYREKIIPKLVGLEIEVVENENWEEGVGSSIACGMEKIAKQNNQGVIVVLGDQPYFTRDLLQKIIAQKEKNKAPIILSKYKKGMGPPTYFDASLFEELKQLKGDVGAKSLIQKYFDKLAFIPFENGHLDVDTDADLDLLN